LNKPWRALLAIATLFSALSSSVSGKVGSGQGYSLDVIDFLKDGHSTQRLVVRKRSHVIIDESEHNFAVFDPFSAEPNLGLDHPRMLVNDLTGDGKKTLIIRIWNGGAHGCYSYDFYSVNENFKKFWHFDAFDGHMLTARMHRNSLPVLYIEDATFKYWGISNLLMPAIPLRWNGHTFSPVRALMLRRFDSNQHQIRVKQVLSNIEQGYWQDFYDYLISLYYSGHAKVAMNLMRQIKTPVYDYEQLHTAFVSRLEKSPFYYDVRAINGGLL
jgi:hypothetical protein